MFWQPPSTRNHDNFYTAAEGAEGFMFLFTVMLEDMAGSGFWHFMDGLSTKVSMNPDIYLHNNTVYASRINTVILFFSVWRYLGDLVNIFSCLWAQHEGTWKQVINCSLRESQIFFLTLIVKIALMMSVSECVFSLLSAEDVDTASVMLWKMM